MSKGARARRRIQRQIKLGVAVTLISMTDTGETYSCGHSGPRGLERQNGPGVIVRHCTKCPPFVVAELKESTEA